jgi:hypothetical protein
LIASLLATDLRREMANMSTDLRGDMFSLSEKLQSSMKDLSTDLLEKDGQTAWKILFGVSGA